MLTGRFMTKREIELHMPTSLGERSPLRTLPLLILSPSSTSAAGRAMRAAATETITTATPPRASECKKVCGKNHIAPVTIETVRPLNRTVRPAVDMVMRTASSTEAPSLRSSLKRFTMSSE